MESCKEQPPPRAPGVSCWSCHISGGCLPQRGVVSPFIVDLLALFSELGQRSSQFFCIRPSLNIALVPWHHTASEDLWAPSGVIGHCLPPSLVTLLVDWDSTLTHCACRQASTPGKVLAQSAFCRGYCYLILPIRFHDDNCSCKCKACSFPFEPCYSSKTLVCPYPGSPEHRLISSSLAECTGLAERLKCQSSKIFRHLTPTLITVYDPDLNRG